MDENETKQNTEMTRYDKKTKEYETQVLMIQKMNCIWSTEIEMLESKSSQPFFENITYVNRKNKV